MAKPKITFHAFADRVRLGLVPPSVQEKETVTRTRALTYRFYSHRHYFSDQLDRRLIKGSVAGLQEADTEYATRAILQVAANATLQDHPGADSITQTLAKGEVVLLPDGTRLKLASGKFGTFSGHVVILEENNDRLRLPANAPVVLPKLSLVENGRGELVRLAAETAAIIPSGNPRPRLFEDFFASAYGPAPAPPEDGSMKPGVFVDRRFPVRELDFEPEGAYSCHNWELFVHAPLLMAIHLSKNKYFEESELCFRYLLDITDAGAGPTPERFWKAKPFQTTEVRQLEEILTNLATGADEELRQRTIRSIEAWQETPFRPFVIARFRQSAFMLKTVMAYYDHHFDWGDHFFRMDTPEGIEEARPHYLLIGNGLNRRPQSVPRKGTIVPRTYAMLKDHLREFGTALEQVESDLPFDLAPLPREAAGGEGPRTLGSIGRGLYFCVPRNEQFLAYWDKVADRLYKIRNSLNFQGIFRRLPLFDPPIDPALLARAAAAGLDIGAVLSGMSQPLPLVRFSTLAPKVSEVAQFLMNMGNAVHSAIEKDDNERLAVIRAKHERNAFEMVLTARYAEWQEAIKNREALEQSYENARQRYLYFQKQLGRKESDINSKVPALSRITFKQLEELQFNAKDLAILPLDPIEPDIVNGGDDAGGKIVSSHEKEELDLLEQSQAFKVAAGVLHALSSVVSPIPNVDAAATPFGVGVKLSIGGVHLSQMTNALASVAGVAADQLAYDAGRSARIGAYARREHDWLKQSNDAAGDMLQIYKQHCPAQIKEYISQKGFDNQKALIKQSQEIEDFLTLEAYEDAAGQEQKGKTFNREAYATMRRDVQQLFGETFNFVFEESKKLERALQHELGDFSQTFIKYDYRSGTEGYLAGEKLYFDLKRMEMAYLELNRREYELTKHISLLQIDPMALLQLRATGRCTVTLPEELFDMDGPGHYFRRIKTVAVTIPSVTGPYTSVNCTLTLVKSSIRTSALVGSDGYARTGADDIRFSDHHGMQSIVTSSAQNDSGMFETNLRDERYLPFEGSGAISEWQLEFPSEVRQFDYSRRVRDVLFHVHLTAREAGGLLRKAAIENLKDKIALAEAAGSIRLFSMRYDFPTEWAKFTHAKIEAGTKTAPLSFDLRPEHFPFWSEGRLKAFRRVDVLAQNAMTKIEITEKEDGTGKVDSLDKDRLLPGFSKGRLTNNRIELDEQQPLPHHVTLNFKQNAIEDVWLAVTWGGPE